MYIYKCLIDLKCTLFKYLNAKVAPTPRPKTNKYGRNFKFMLGFFLNKKVKNVNFFSEYGGYFALKLYNILQIKLITIITAINTYEEIDSPIML